MSSDPLRFGLHSSRFHMCSVDISKAKLIWVWSALLPLHVHGVYDVLFVGPSHLLDLLHRWILHLGQGLLEDGKAFIWLILTYHFQSTFKPQIFQNFHSNAGTVQLYLILNSYLIDYYKINDWAVIEEINWRRTLHDWTVFFSKKCIPLLHRSSRRSLLQPSHAT